MPSEDLKVQRAESREVCPYCKDSLAEERTTCEGCGAGYHAACWGELGGCGTIGCANRSAPQRAAPAAPENQRLNSLKVPCRETGCTYVAVQESKGKLCHTHWVANRRFSAKASLICTLIWCFVAVLYAAQGKAGLTALNVGVAAIWLWITLKKNQEIKRLTDDYS